MLRIPPTPLETKRPDLGPGFDPAMAEKISKLAIKVDLDCPCCYKKIRKILCKLQERENIKTISYDEKNNTVTISGPFDPQKLSNKLRCKACKVIKDIQIIVDPPTKPKVTQPKQNPEGKTEEPTKKKSTPEPVKVINDIQITVGDPPKDPKCPDQKAKKEPESDLQPKTVPYQPPAVWLVCCPMPYYVGHHGGYRCCSCGKVYGCMADRPPMVYGGTSYGGCQLICEENPSTSCTIM